MLNQKYDQSRTLTDIFIKQYMQNRLLILYKCVLGCRLFPFHLEAHILEKEFGWKRLIHYDQVWIMSLKLFNNSSSLNKENHDRDGVWISDLN